MPPPVASYLTVARALVRGRFKTSHLESVQLSFNATPPIRSYLYGAYNTGILTATNPSWDALAPLYIQLFFPYAKLISPEPVHRVDFFPQLVTRHYAALGYITTAYWDRAEFMAAQEDDLIRRIATTLSEGRYVLCTLNEFYLPGTGAFLRSDFRHTCLIIGYRSSGHTFLVVGYAEDGSFGIREVPAHLVVQGIRSTRRSRKGTYPAEATIIAIERCANPPHPPGTAVLLEQLRSYARDDCDGRAYTAKAFGVDKTNLFESVGRFTTSPGEYGVKVYSLFRLYLGVASARWHELDLRASRILYEHKIVLRQVLRLLADRGVGVDLSPSFSRVVALAREFHLTCFAYNKESQQSTIDRATALLGDIEAGEREILDTLLEDDLVAKTPLTRS